MKVLLLKLATPAAPLVDAIRALDPSIELLPYHADASDAELAQVEVALGWSLPVGVAPRLPRLAWVASVAAGVEKLLAPDLPPQVVVSRIVDPEQAVGIAQHVALMALRHVRGLPMYEAQQCERRWVREPIAAAHPRVAVLGAGAVGREIARVLDALGFAVRTWSRSSGGPLDEALAAADIVVCALPLTPATHAILDAHAFALMPRGGYVINVARGQHVVEADLIAAIRAGHLAGAALDVQAHEPLPADDPLWSVPGVVITPHIAAQSSTATIAAQFVDAVHRHRRGEPVPNRVDRALGY
ncbi:NAD(P)-dependent oxidoreductase [Piscinibacter koreensis]|uniref:Glyoxylate/hydroxypyruvate reductase A n=1 Tax=Piscinibacter koreensis TaxID=2742824 RepID=A0A7Y6NLN4_9BURK|nr:NAD(P)-dependent oxidoreductase [Schlegelella koreensis]NUZ05445.1 glyoxylate/hydroxypyruvate reductase A [Schlegelella koreensis]